MKTTPNIKDKLSLAKGDTETIHHLDIQDRIIQDIKQMDMDDFASLIEHMYPVKATNIDDNNIEIKVDSSKGLTTLKEIF